MTTKIQHDLLNLLEVARQQYNNFFRSGRRGKIKMAIAHPIKSFIRKCESLTVKQRFPFTVRAKTFFGCPIKVFGCSYQKDLWFCGLSSKPSDVRFTKYLIKNLRSHDVFFDIGAHHGYYALLARKIMGQSAPIHAFEPSPFHFKILASNTSCQNIILNKFALFSSDGPLAFHDMATGAGSSIINRLLAREIKMRTVTVASTTLDHYCFSHNIYPSFLKIDIESSEFEMLKGGKETLTACKPIIAMEVLGKPYDYANHLRAIAFLKENGYMPFAINDNGDLEPLSDIVPDRDIPFCSDNYIFKAQS